jgi:hypothetical protein
MVRSRPMTGPVTALVPAPQRQSQVVAAVAIVWVLGIAALWDTRIDRGCERAGESAAPHTVRVGTN